jgi:hypothetical protein
MAATVDSEAYITLFMHACKYPSRTVNGLLLGSVSDGGVSVQKALPLFHTPLGLAPMLEAALMLVWRLRTLAVVSLAGLTCVCCTGRPTNTARRTRCKWWAITRPTSCATTWSSGRSARPLRRRSARSANMRRCCWCVPLPALAFALTCSILVAASCEQVDGAKMHPTEDNLRLVPVLSSASVPAPTLSEPAATLETLELALGRGAFRDPRCPMSRRAHSRQPRARAGVQHNVVDFDEHLDDASKDWFNTSLLS